MTLPDWPAAMRLLTDEKRSVIIACGAMLMHYGKAETIAGIQAAMALARAREQENDNG